MHRAHISHLKYGRSRHKPAGACSKHCLQPPRRPPSANYLLIVSLPRLRGHSRPRCRLSPGLTDADRPGEGGLQQVPPQSWLTVDANGEEAPGPQCGAERFWQRKICYNPPTTTYFHHSPSHRFTTHQHTSAVLVPLFGAAFQPVSSVTKHGGLTASLAGLTPA